MRAHLLAPLAAATVLALVAPACSSASGADRAARTSPERPTTTVAPRSSGKEAPGGGSEPTIPDMGDLGLGDLGNCADLLGAYLALYPEVMSGSDGAEKARQKAEKLKKKLPASLHDDIDVVVAAIAKVAKEGLLSVPDALDSPDYQAANKAITDYLYNSCKDAAGSGGAPDSGSKSGDPDTGGA